MYAVAFFCPPLACLLERGILSAILNFFLCIMCYFPGLLHALGEVKAAERERHSELLGTVRQSGQRTEDDRPRRISRDDDNDRDRPRRRR